MKEAIKNARDIVLFELENIVVSKSSNMWMNEIEKYVFPYLLAIPKDMRVDNYIRLISEKTGLSPDGIRNDFNNYLKKNSSQIDKRLVNIEDVKKKDSRHDTILRKLYGLLLFLEKKTDLVDIYEKFKSRLEEILTQEKLKDIEKLTDTEKEALIFEAELMYNTNNITRDIDELLLNIEEEQLSEKLTKKQQALRLAESSQNLVLTEELLKECHDISQKINNLKKRRL